MDKPISTQKKRNKQIRQAIRILLVLAGLAAAFFALRSVLHTRVKTGDFQYAKVEQGTIEHTITASGLVVPAFEQQIVAPIATSIRKVHHISGDEVKAGEAIMQLDDEFVRLQYTSLQDELEVRKNNITRLGFEYDKTIKDLDYENQIKALQLSSLEAQLSDTERLRKIGSATQEEVDQARLSLNIAQLEKKKLENELHFRQQVLSGDQRNLELEVAIQDKKLSELGRKLQETNVQAPRTGVITWINEDIGKKVNEGELLVRLADLGRFRVEASCSDRYAQYVKTGQPVRVRINRTDLTGLVTAILPAVENNTISFIVALDEPAHERLRPNLRVEVFLIAGKREQALRLRNGPVFTGAARQHFFRVKDGKATRTSAAIGLSSIDYVELTETDLQVGDQVIISDMKQYDHLEFITLK